MERKSIDDIINAILYTTYKNYQYMYVGATTKDPIDYLLKKELKSKKVVQIFGQEIAVADLNDVRIYISYKIWKLKKAEQKLIDAINRKKNEGLNVHKTSNISDDEEGYVYAVFFNKP